MSKILFDGSVLDGSPQGTTSYIQGMAEALSHDHEVTVLCRSYKSFRKYFGFQSKVSFQRMRSNSIFPRLFFEIPLRSRFGGYDFVFSQYLTPVIKTTKQIVCIHDLVFLDYPQFFSRKYSFIRRLLFKYSASRSDIVCTVSDYSKNSLMKWFNIDKEKIIVTKNAVDLQRFNKISAVPELECKDFFLYVSRIEPRKNHIALVDALLHSNLSTFHLVFAGSATFGFEELVEYIQEVGLNDRISFLVPTDSELAWLYRNCSATFYPSMCEGFGIPVIESVMLGAKTFVANNTALAELKPLADDLFTATDTKKITELMEFSANNSSTNRDDIEPIDFSWHNSVFDLLRKIDEMD